MSTARMDDAAGVVLAGGQSRRMGRSKAALAVDGDSGRTLLADRVALLAQVVDPVWVSLPFGAAAAPRAIVDGVASPGPLAGIDAALARLEATGRRWLLVLAVDMPNVPVALLWRLFAARQPGGVALAQHPTNGRREPLVSCWHRDARPVVSRCLAQGERAVRTALDALPTAVVPVRPEEAGWLANLNTPEDWEAWRRGRA